LQDESINVWDYVKAILYETWTWYIVFFDFLYNLKLMLCRHAFPIPHYRIDTNNIIESINSVWGKIRQLPPLQMIDAIYTYLIELVHNQSQEKQHSKHFADVPLARFNDRLQRSQRYQVFGSGNGIY
jgi:hypothetical protein